MARTDAPVETRADVALEAWCGFTREALRDRFGVPDLRLYAEVDSTNDRARAEAEAGAAHGATVLAEHQRAGRGRMGRAWADRSGGALLLSMVLRPDPAADPLAADAPPVLPLRVGLACARAIREAAGIDVGIEWPNDLVVRDRKLGGILCEGSSRAGRLEYVIAGIGLNVLDVPAGLDAAAAARATSIAAIAGGTPDRVAVAAAVARAVLALRPGQPLGEDELAALRGLDSLAGRRVRLGTGREARARIILHDGSLELEDADGSTFRVNAGSVAPILT